MSLSHQIWCMLNEPPMAALPPGKKPQLDRFQQQLRLLRNHQKGERLVPLLGLLTHVDMGHHINKRRGRQKAASLVPWLDQNAECPPPLLSLLARAEGIVANGCALAQNPNSCSAMLQSRMNIFGRTMVRPCCRPP